MGSDKKFYKEQSRLNWYTNADKLDIEQLKFGAILRIADSLEKIEKRYSDLINEKERFEKWYREECDRNRKLNKKISGIKSHTTRLKNIINSSKKQVDKPKKMNKSLKGVILP